MRNQVTHVFLALLSCSILTNCAGQLPVPTEQLPVNQVVKPKVDSSIWECIPAPQVGDIKTDVDLAKLTDAYRKRGDDCAEHLAKAKQATGN